MTGAMLTLLVFPLVGAAMARLVGRTSMFLLGLGTVGLVLHLTLLLRAPIVPVLIVMVVISIGILASRRPPQDLVPAAESHPAATLLLIAPVAVLLFTSFVTPLRDYDGRAFWLLKAKAIAHEQRIDGPFFRGQTMYDPRNEYPLLVPIDDAAIMSATRDLDERQVRWIYPLALLALAWHARRWLGPWPAALLTWLPQLAVVRNGGATSAYNDVILAAFAGCAFFELIDPQSPLRFGLWLSFLTLTKNEGLPFAIVLFVAGVFIFRRRIALAAAPLTGTMAMLFFWRSLIPPGDEENLVALLPRLPEKIGRLAPALQRFASYAVRFDVWGLFWVAVVLAAVAVVVVRRWRTALLPVYIIVAMTFVYVSVYAVSTWIMSDLIESSADRLLTHLVAPAVYLIASSVRSR